MIKDAINMFDIRLWCRRKMGSIIKYNFEKTCSCGATARRTTYKNLDTGSVTLIYSVSRYTCDLAVKSINENKFDDSMVELVTLLTSCPGFKS